MNEEDKLARILAMDNIHVAPDVYAALKESGHLARLPRIRECAWLEPGTILGIQNLRMPDLIDVL